MKRSQLEHLIRAAGAIADERDIVVVGSQSILGSVPSPPAALVQSMEADVFPLEHPERSELIDGAIGELSAFHEQFGYYAQGVSPHTAVLPRGWQSRLHVLENQNTNGVAGHCLDPHDLALSKYAAGRPKDRAFNRVLIQHGYVRKGKLLKLLEEMPVDGQRRQAIAQLIATDLVFSPSP